MIITLKFLLYKLKKFLKKMSPMLPELRFPDIQKAEQRSSRSDSALYNNRKSYSVHSALRSAENKNFRSQKSALIHLDPEYHFSAPFLPCPNFIEVPLFRGREF